MDINSIFDNRTVKERIPSRTYDVSISVNDGGKRKDGTTRWIVRFGLLNQADVAFGGSQYIQPSNIEKSPERIYFRTHEEKTYLDCYKLRRNGGENTSLHFELTPTTAEGRKIYKKSWADQCFLLQYDDENGLFYIDLSKKWEGGAA